jgi:predicted Mrr-cat superfamily restriction endonuclease
MTFPQSIQTFYQNVYYDRVRDLVSNIPCDQISEEARNTFKALETIDRETIDPNQVKVLLNDLKNLSKTEAVRIRVEVIKSRLDDTEKMKASLISNWLDIQKLFIERATTVQV